MAIDFHDDVTGAHTRQLRRRTVNRRNDHRLAVTRPDFNANAGQPSLHGGAGFSGLLRRQEDAVTGVAQGFCHAIDGAVGHAGGVNSAPIDIKAIDQSPRLGHQPKFLRGVSRNADQQHPAIQHRAGAQGQRQTERDGESAPDAD